MSAVPVSLACEIICWLLPGTRQQGCQHWRLSDCGRRQRAAVCAPAGPRENAVYLSAAGSAPRIECPLSGVAPPLKRCEGPPRADAGAVCGLVDRAKHFAVQLLEHCRKARPLLGIARAALRGELQQRPGAARGRDAVER